MANALAEEDVPAGVKTEDHEMLDADEGDDLSDAQDNSEQDSSIMNAVGILAQLAPQASVSL